MLTWPVCGAHWFSTLFAVWQGRPRAWARQELVEGGLSTGRSRSVLSGARNGHLGERSVSAGGKSGLC